MDTEVLGRHMFISGNRISGSIVNLAHIFNIRTQLYSYRVKWYDDIIS